LALLLDVSFPQTLETNLGWKGPPEDLNAELHRHIVQGLKRLTKQDLGDKKEAWIHWLDSQAAPALPKLSP
jgi:hypothetical protein